MLPFKENIVYIEINNADTFGDIDFVVASGDQEMNIEEMFENINTVTFNMVRQFTVQALENTTLLTLSIKNIKRMQKQFNAQFKRLFKHSENGLQKAFDLKLQAIASVDDPSQILSEAEFREKQRKGGIYRKLSKINGYGI